MKVFLVSTQEKEDKIMNEELSKKKELDDLDLAEEGSPQEEPEMQEPTPDVNGDPMDAPMPADPAQEEAEEEENWEETHEDVPEVIASSEEAPEESLEQPQEKMLTQSQVNELVGRARQEGRMSAVKELLERYGVGDENELNDVFGRGQAYDSLNDEYNHQGQLYAEVMAENALLKSQVDFNRWEDIKLILNGKGLEVSEENIQALLPSHPEWKSSVASPEATPMGAAPAETPQPSIIHKLGEDASPDKDEMSEEELVRKLYGI